MSVLPPSSSFNHNLIISGSINQLDLRKIPEKEQNEKLIIESVIKSPDSFQFIGQSFVRNDQLMKNLMEKIAKNYPHSFDHFIIIAKLNGSMLKNMPATAQDNEDVVAAAIESNAEAFKSASQRLKGDYNLVIMACAKDIHSIHHVDKRKVREILQRLETDTQDLKNKRELINSLQEIALKSERQQIARPRQIFQNAVKKVIHAKAVAKGKKARDETVMPQQILSVLRKLMPPTVEQIKKAKMVEQIKNRAKEKSEKEEKLNSSMQTESPKIPEEAIYGLERAKEVRHAALVICQKINEMIADPKNQGTDHSFIALEGLIPLLDEESQKLIKKEKLNSGILIQILRSKNVAQLTFVHEELGSGTYKIVSDAPTATISLQVETEPTRMRSIYERAVKFQPTVLLKLKDNNEASIKDVIQGMETFESALRNSPGIGNISEIGRILDSLPQKVAPSKEPSPHIYLQKKLIDLQKIETAFRPLTLSEKLKIIRQNAQLLKGLHAQGIGHRDVKSPNILVSVDDKGEIYGFPFDPDLIHNFGRVDPYQYEFWDICLQQSGEFTGFTDVYSLAVALGLTLTKSFDSSQAILPNWIKPNGNYTNLFKSTEVFFDRAQRIIPKRLLDSSTCRSFNGLKNLVRNEIERLKGLKISNANANLQTPLEVEAEVKALESINANLQKLLEVEAEVKALESLSKLIERIGRKNVELAEHLNLLNTKIGRESIKKFTKKLKFFTWKIKLPATSSKLISRAGALTQMEHDEKAAKAAISSPLNGTAAWGYIIDSIKTRRKVKEQDFLPEEIESQKRAIIDILKTNHVVHPFNMDTSLSDLLKGTEDLLMKKFEEANQQEQLTGKPSKLPEVSKLVFPQINFKQESEKVLRDLNRHLRGDDTLLEDAVKEMNSYVNQLTAEHFKEETSRYIEAMKIWFPWSESILEKIDFSKLSPMESAKKMEHILIKYIDENTPHISSALQEKADKLMTMSRFEKEIRTIEEQLNNTIAAIRKLPKGKK